MGEERRVKSEVALASAESFASVNMNLVIVVSSSVKGAD